MKRDLIKNLIFFFLKKVENFIEEHIPHSLLNCPLIFAVHTEYIHVNCTKYMYVLYMLIVFRNVGGGKKCVQQS